MAVSLLQATLLSTAPSLPPLPRKRCLRVNNNTSFHCRTSSSVYSRSSISHPFSRFYHIQTLSTTSCRLNPRSSAEVHASEGASLWSVESFEGKIARVLEQTTPVKFVKWTTIGAAAVTFLKLGYGLVSEPSFWMYSSWIFVVWPWPAALALGIWSLRAAAKQKEGKAKLWEQFLILAGALTWLILVPLGQIHGYVDGWPLTLFFLYAWFFLASSVARFRLFGNLSARKEDKQWSSSPSRIAQIALTAVVVGGHWLAAKEAPHLMYTWNWQWPSRVASFVFVLSLSLHYYATYFLGKYSDNLVVPHTVVVFGPYRFVRHPIYASYMLLFAGYCVALRAYKSMAFIVLACILYYEQRVKLEEDMLVEAFPDLYTSYRNKVTKKFFPFIY